jgi:hypothetical protein
LGIQKVREEKKFKNDKHDKELDQDDHPQPFAKGTEIPEPLVIEVKDPCKDAFLQNASFINKQANK